MKIVVTGGAGFIGSQLTDFLLNKGHKVTVIDNLSWGKKELLKQAWRNPNFNFQKIDLLDKKTLLSNFPNGIDTVFHLAANSDIMRGSKEPEVDLQNTTIATFNLLDTMRLKNCRQIFYTSGSGVYGDVGKKTTYETFGPLLPISMYGASKLSAEGTISAFVNLYDMQAWILRPANIIGPRATHGVIFDFINQLQKNPNKLKILGDGSQSKSYLYVTDVINAIHLVWTKTKNPINLFNISSNSFVTVKEISQIVTEEMGLNPRIEFTGGNRGWKGDVPIVRISNKRIEKLGWECNYNSKEAIRKNTRVLLEKEV